MFTPRLAGKRLSNKYTPQVGLVKIMALSLLVVIDASMAGRKGSTHTCLYVRFVILGCVCMFQSGLAARGVNRYGMGGAKCQQNIKKHLQVVSITALQLKSNLKRPLTDTVRARVC